MKKKEGKAPLSLRSMFISFLFSMSSISRNFWEKLHSSAAQSFLRTLYDKVSNQKHMDGQSCYLLVRAGHIEGLQNRKAQSGPDSQLRKRQAK